MSEDKKILAGDIVVNSRDKLGHRILITRSNPYILRGIFVDQLPDGREYNLSPNAWEVDVFMTEVYKAGRGE